MMPTERSGAEGDALRQELQRSLEDTFLFEFGGAVNEDSNLFRLGLVDSFGYIQMLRDLEMRYGIRFGDDELLDNVLVSLSSIVGAVTAKIGSTGAGCAG
jgi:acyl carrier protein